jgi:regulator of sigma E protease
MMPSPSELDAARLSITEREGADAVSGYFHFKPLYQKFLIILAGPVANFILAIIAFTAIGLMVPKVTIAPLITKVEAQSPAFLAGLRPGDLITAIDNKPMVSAQDVTIAVILKANSPLVITFLRDSKTLSATATPKLSSIQGMPDGSRAQGGRLGITIGAY